MIRIVSAFGTRAEAIKFAPLIRELKRRPDRFDVRVVVSGVHRRPIDKVMDLFEIQPDFMLARDESQEDLASLFSDVSKGLSEAFAQFEPDLVLVLGDTVTTLAASLVAYYRQIPVVHIEAGLRVDHKFTTFPEEGHRLMVSSVADLHFAPTELCKSNLLAGGIAPEAVYVTGNPGIDAVLWAKQSIESLRRTKELRLVTLFKRHEEEKVSARFLRAMRSVESGKRRMVLFTGSRRESFGGQLQSIIGALARLSDEFPDVIFVYPAELPEKLRLRVYSLLSEHDNIFLLPALNYVPFVFLMTLSHFVITDSGTIQEEAPGLGKPVLCTRRTTDRPEAVDAGTVKLVGTDAVTIVTAARRLLNDEVHYKRVCEAENPYGKGNSAEAIALVLEDYALEMAGEQARLPA